jgi:hypothetical protein
MSLIIYLILLGIGYIIGSFKKQYLIYGYFLLLPFYSVGYINLINLKMSEIIKYHFALPMFILILVSFIKNKKVKREILVIYLFVISFLIYMIIPILLSTNKILIVHLSVLILQFIVFLYVISFYKSLRNQILVRLSKYIMIIQFPIVIMQFLGDQNRFLKLIFSIDEFDSVPAGSFYRATGTFMDPNYFSLFIGVLTVFILKFEVKTYRIFFAIVGILTILMSLSRMGIILVGIIIMLIYLENIKELSLKSYGKLITLTVMVLVLLQSDFLNSILAIFAERINNEGGLEASPRSLIAKVYFEEILNISNFIFGLGFESIGNYTVKYLGQPWIAHNQYIQILADVGFIGYIFIFIFILWLIKYLRIKKIKYKGYFPIIIVLMVGGMFLTLTYQLYIPILLGLFISQIIYYQVDNEE